MVFTSVILAFTLTVITVNVTVMVFAVVIWVEVKERLLVFVFEIFFASPLRISFDPIISASRVEANVVNVVIAVKSSVLVSKAKPTLLFFAVAVSTLLVLLETLFNFSKD